MGLSRQEYPSGLPFPPPGNLPDLGIEPTSPALASRFFTIRPPGKLVDTHHSDFCLITWLLPHVSVSPPGRLLPVMERTREGTSLGSGPRPAPHQQASLLQVCSSSLFNGVIIHSAFKSRMILGQVSAKCKNVGPL